MLIDSQEYFDDNVQHLTTEYSSNSIDSNAISRDLGTGKEIYIEVIVKEAFTDVGSDTTVTATLDIDTTAAFLTPTIAQTLGTFPALSAIGTRLIARLQPGAIIDRHMKVKYTFANGDLMTGKFSSFLTLGIDSNRTYPNNSTIS
jgi:hypothetical protein